MLKCPSCGHEMFEDDIDELDEGDEIECEGCQRVWAVVELEPLRLEEVSPADEEERDE